MCWFLVEKFEDLSIVYEKNTIGSPEVLALREIRVRFNASKDS